MDIPDIGELITPVDDPCQYNPAWRSIVAGYMFSAGVRPGDDLKSIAMTGSVTVIVTVTHEEKERGKEKGKKGKGHKAKKKQRQKTDTRKAPRPIPPFDTNPEYRAFASDKWIAKFLSMLEEESSFSPTSDECVPVKLATRWYSEMDHEAAMKKRIESLLLTEIGMDIIALDLTGVQSSQPAIEAYERLYFNCRDDNFNLSPSLQLVQRMAMPYGPLKTYLHKWEEIDPDGFVIGDGRPLAKESDVWKAIGATMGYEALMYYWRWDGRAHGIKDRSLAKMIEMGWKASVSRLLSDLYTGDIKHEDAARVLASFTSQLKFMEDKKNGSGQSGANDTTKALMNILYLAAPKMVQFDEEEEASKNDEIQSRIKSQLAINKQAIEDHGKQVEAEIVDAQISSAVEQ